MKRSSLLLLLIVAFSFPGFCHPGYGANLDNQNYRRAFAALDAGHFDSAMVFTVHGHDPILNKVLRSSYMAQPGNDSRFEEMAEFVGENPDWPGLNGILAIAEQKIPSYFSPRQIINWFIAHPPQGLNGFYRFTDALNAEGKADVLIRAVHARWIDGTFTKEELQSYHARFATILTRDDHWARLDRLLWKSDAHAARDMYEFVNADQKAVAEARLGLAEHSSKIKNLLKNVSPAFQSDPGLKYELIRWQIIDKMDDLALKTLEQNPEKLGHADLWWEARQIMVRRLMEKHDYTRAYKMTAEHGKLSDKNELQAEFLAGWLALRLLHQPETAEQHFQKFCDLASTPVSRARGDYWLGRTYEELDDNDLAEQSFQDAAVLNTTYYGQLAAVHLNPNAVLTINPEPNVPGKIREEFYSRDIVVATQHLYALGELDRAHTFFKAALDTAVQRVEFVLVSELAYKLKRLDWAVETSKAANQKNLLLSASGFPLLDHHIATPPEPALTYALIRQESMFNTNAASPAGARGLMQLMPTTARSMAKEIGVKFKQSQLGNPDYNMRLGREYIIDLLNHNHGSYVLTLAGYNAGMVHVNDWLSEFGDPRNPNVDPVDWVELIPISETRNYVQRIIESLQTYRAEENGGEAPLLILKDLRR